MKNGLAKFTVKYQPGPDGDKKAIEDIKDYLTPKQWAYLEEALKDTAYSFQDCNVAIGFAGIRGYPGHALLRTYRLDQYRAWMREGGSITDKHGFPTKITIVK